MKQPAMNTNIIHFDEISGASSSVCDLFDDDIIQSMTDNYNSNRGGSQFDKESAGDPFDINGGVMRQPSASLTTPEKPPNIIEEHT